MEYVSPQIRRFISDVMSKYLKKTWVLCLLASVSCFLWGSAFPGVKIGYEWFQIASDETAAQILFAGCRFFLAGILVIFFGSLAAGKFLLPSGEQWKHASLISLFQTILQYILFYIGLAHTAGTKASIIVGSNVFIAILTASLIFRQEKLTREKILGCAIGFAGVVLINWLPGGMSLAVSFVGEGLVLLSTVAYAFSSVIMKKYSRIDNPVMLSGYQFLIGGIVMTVVGFCMGGRISVPSGKAVLMLLYLAFASAMAYTIWSQLLKYNPVSRVAVFCFMTPVFGVILSALLLHESEQISIIQGAAALALITFGIIVSYREKPLTV